MNADAELADDVWESCPHRKALAKELAALYRTLADRGLPTNEIIAKLRGYAFNATALERELDLARLRHEALNRPAEADTPAEQSRASRAVPRRARPLPTGVYRATGDRFVAQLRIEGKLRSLGTFASPAEASAAFKCAHVAHHGERSRYFAVVTSNDTEDTGDD